MKITLNNDIIENMKMWKNKKKKKREYNGAQIRWKLP